MNISRSRPAKMVRYTLPIVLIGGDAASDGIGNQLSGTEERTVYGQELGAGLTSLSVPGLSGLRGVKQFEMWKSEYHGEKKLRIGPVETGTVYRVAHTQSYDARAVRLLCEEA